jgi:hypothetical protein
MLVNLNSILLKVTQNINTFIFYLQRDYINHKRNFCVTIEFLHINFVKSAYIYKFEKAKNEWIKYYFSYNMISTNDQH